MPSRHYMPRKDAQFVLWLENYAAKLAAYAPQLEIAPGKVIEIQESLIAVRTMIEELYRMKNDMKSKTAAKKALIQAAIQSVRHCSRIMKVAKNYSTVIGLDLGIELPPYATVKRQQLDGAKPIFFMTSLPDCVRIDWVKRHFTGIIIQCKRGSEKEFVTLDRDFVSPYDDKRPNLHAGIPEMRTYRLCYCIDEKMVGEFSDEATVVCNL